MAQCACVWCVYFVYDLSAGMGGGGRVAKTELFSGSQLEDVTEVLIDGLID